MCVHTIPEIQIRHEIRPGDLGRVVELHGRLYFQEYGFDHRFEAYVAQTIGEFARDEFTPEGRLWLAESDSRLLGAVGAVMRESRQAQLRWLLVSPEARGRGLGRQLVQEVINFSKAAGCESVYLWTVSPLSDAARLYRACGFEMTSESVQCSLWGVELSEQRYELSLRSGA